MYKVHARESRGPSGLQAVEKVVEVMYTLELCDEVNECPNSLVSKQPSAQLDRDGCNGLRVISLRILLLRGGVVGIGSSY